MKRIEQRAAALRRRVEKEQRAASGRVRYSARLREDVVSFIEQSGMSRTRVAELLSLSETGLHRWLQKSRETVGRDRGTRLQRVEVVADKPSREEQALELVFPNGARVIGLSIKHVSELLGGKS